jgi:hypothetical protein
VPADDEAVVMTVAPDPLAAELLLAAALVLLPPLLHAATSSAAPNAPPTAATSLAVAGTRFTLDFLIMFVSRLARLSPVGQSDCSVSTSRFTEPSGRSATVAAL